MNSMSVTVYTTGPDCSRCRATMKLLDRAGIAYLEVNVRENPEARAYVTDELGYSEAPVCVVEGAMGRERWSGFRPDHITRLAVAVSAHVQL